MALLLNRKYGSRLECLYYILKATYKKYNDSTFKMKGLKYEEDVANVYSTCGLLLSKMGRHYCPYLDNPLNPSRCYATQSVDSDSTKMKAASDVARSLEALGFVRPVGKGFSISEEGIKWVSSNFNSQEWFNIVKKAVLSYGAVIGFLHKTGIEGSPFNSSKIYLSYPITEDPEELSADSTKDSNTRTVSKIVSWCVTAGLIEPIGVEHAQDTLPQLKYRSFVNAPQLRARSFNLTPLYKDVFKEKLFIANPLSYMHLNKNVGSIRERGSEDIRKRTMKNNDKILNRRFIFIYVLNKLSMNNSRMKFSKFINALIDYEGMLFLHGSDINMIMQTEAAIADICGIPFSISGDTLIPKTKLNEEVLIQGAPDKIIDAANKIFEGLK